MRTFRRLLCAVLFCSIPLSVITAQTQNSHGPKMSSMPSRPAMPSGIDTPNMPSISAPTLGGKFYTPGNFGKNVQEKQTEQYSANGSLLSETSAAKYTGTSSEQTLRKLTDTDISTSLTASDISLLGQEGLLDGMYSLTNGRKTSGTMLSEILSQLNSIKKEQEERKISQTAEKPEATVSTEPHTKNSTAMRPAILRFVINGYNVLDTCRTVYFSRQENDGTFLLTADRKYLSDNTTRTETFYILFKADGNCGASKGYDIQPAVVQDYQNEYSLVYQLAQKKNLRAVKTGNLVTLRSSSADWNLDLLLDIGE